MLALFFTFLAVSFFVPNVEAASRTTPFWAGQTLDPGAESTEPCGPSDANCFPSVLRTSDEGTSLSANALNLNFVGAGVIATHSGTTTTITISGGVSSALTLLNGSASTSQSFAVGGTGTDFTISTAAGVHTFNIPTASATNRGLLSATDWSAFNSKVSSARQLLTGTGLTGGGDLTSDRSLSLDIDGLTVDGTLNSSDALALYDADSGTVRKMTRSTFLSGITGALTYQGTFNAAVNSPALATGSGSAGQYYVVSVAGTQNIGVGASALVLSVGDWVVRNGSDWERLANGGAVSSVFGRTGGVVASNGDYTALQITNATSGTISSLTVQAAINELDTEKLSNALVSGSIWIGNGSNVANSQVLSGDATLSNAGVLTLGTGVVTTGNILNGTIGVLDLASNAVDGTKLSLASESTGDLMYFDGTDWARLAAGSAGQILAVSGGVPSWMATSSIATTLANISGVLSVAKGGTGTSTTPLAGRLLIGNASGGYDFIATSSLGINSGVWGSITGTLSNQSDLQNALSARLSLGDWHATTTSALAEGTNLYFTTARGNANFAANLAATTTSALAEGVNLYWTQNRFNTAIQGTSTLSHLTVGTSSVALTASALAGFNQNNYLTLAAWQATTTSALAEGSNLYFTTARGNSNFATNLAATTTTALAEGSNLYFTTARGNSNFASNLAATTTSALAEGNNLYWTNARFDTRLAATTSLPGLTLLAGLTSIGSSGTTTAVAGALSVAQGLLLASSTPATTTNALYNIGGTLYWNGTPVGTGVGGGYSSVTISDRSSGGDIGTAVATVDTYTNFNINQTTTLQTLTLPSPTATSTTVGKIITVNNVGTANFTIGGITVPAGSYGSAFVWNGTVWNPLNAASNVSAEYGVHTGITSGGTLSSASFADVPGSSFTLPSAGTWKVTYNLVASADSAVAIDVALVSGDNAVFSNSQATVNTPASGSKVILTNTAYITATSSATYKLRARLGSGTATFFNAASAPGGESTITYEKVSGNAPVTGQSVDYAQYTYTNTGGISISADGSVIPLDTVVSGNIPLASNRFTLTAGKTYRLVGVIPYGGGGSPNIDTQFYNVTAGSYIGSTRSSVLTSTLANTGFNEAIFTPTVTTQVEFRLRTSAGGSYTLVSGDITRQQGPSVSVTQLGSSAFTSDSIVAQGGNTLSSTGNTLAVGTLNNNALTLISSSTEAMRLLTTGQVLIGTTTPASATLFIAGTSTASTRDLFTLASSTGAVLFNVRASGNVGIGTTTAQANLVINGTTGQNLFQVATSTNQSILILNAQGALGLGTSSPVLNTAGSLSLSGSLYVGGSATSTFAGGLSVGGSSGLVVLGNGAVGIGTAVNPFGGALTAGLTLNNAFVLASSTALSTTTHALYNSNGTLFWNGSAVGSNIAMSALSGATTVDTLDNTNFAQTWNWSTATSANALTLNAGSLTTGALLSLTTATGDTALSILGNILPTSAPTETTSTSTTVTSIDSGNAGGHISATMGADGYPVIAYFLVVGGGLKVIKCGNAACSSGNTITTIDNSGSVGRFTDIALGTDNFPVISYHDSTNGDLKVAKCGNAACSSGNTVTTIDSSSTIVGKHTSLAIGTDGFPVISYYDETNTNLKVMKCGNAACSSLNSSTTADSTGDIGEYTSLAIGTDGFPVISYYDNTNDDLKVLKCGNAACTSSNSTTTLDSTDSVGLYTSLAIGTDGFPVVAYYDNTGANLRFLKCSNTACTAGSTTTIQSTGDIGRFPSVAIGVDGLPVIAYEDILAEDPRVVKCANAGCTSSNNFFQSLPDAEPTGDYNALLISTDGSPLVVTDTGGITAVRVTKFSSTFATGIGGLSLFTGGADIGNQANYFNNIYAAQLWGKRLTVANFDLAENYAVADMSLEAGDVVAMNSDGKLVKAGSSEAVRTLGVISTAPGLLLSNWVEEGEAVKPVALAGRVPVKIASNEVVEVGDALTVSEREAGKVRKAKGDEMSVGYVLSALDGNLVEMFVELSQNGDMLSMNFASSTFSAFATSTLSEIVASGALTTSERFYQVAAVLDTLGSSTAPVVTDDGEITYLGRVFERLAKWLGDTANGIATLFAKEIRTEKLCVGNTCVTEAELQELLKAQGVQATNPDPEESGEVADSDPDSNSATTTGAVNNVDNSGQGGDSSSNVETEIVSEITEEVIDSAVSEESEPEPVAELEPEVIPGE